jgi:cell shape-determining protein MreC
MMMARSRFSSAQTQRGLVVLAVVLVVGVFFSPWIHSVLVSVLAIRGDGGGEYSTLPRAVLIERLRTAEDELENIRYQAVVYETTARAYEELKREVGARDPEAHMTARVIAVPPRTHYDTIVLRAGTEDGVLPDDIAMVEGVALGIVTEVYPYSSIVELYSAPGRESDAHVSDAGATVVVVGVGGGALETRAPAALAIAVGETVTDPRTGYVFGIVSDIVARDIDTEQRILIALPHTLQDLTYVSLVHRSE